MEDRALRSEMNVDTTDRFIAYCCKQNELSGVVHR